MPEKWDGEKEVADDDITNAATLRIGHSSIVKVRSVITYSRFLSFSLYLCLIHTVSSCTYRALKPVWTTKKYRPDFIYNQETNSNQITRTKTKNTQIVGSIY